MTTGIVVPPSGHVEEVVEEEGKGNPQRPASEGTRNQDKPTKVLVIMKQTTGQMIPNLGSSPLNFPIDGITGLHHHAQSLGRCPAKL